MVSTTTAARTTEKKPPARKAPAKTAAKPASKRTAKKEEEKESPVQAAKPEQGDLLDSQKPEAAPTPVANPAALSDELRGEIKAAAKEAMLEMVASPEFTENIKQRITNIISTVFQERADKALGQRRATLSPSSNPRPIQKPGRREGRRERGPRSHDQNTLQTGTPFAADQMDETQAPQETVSTTAVGSPLSRDPEITQAAREMGDSIVQAIGDNVVNDPQYNRQAAMQGNFRDRKGKVYSFDYDLNTNDGTIGVQIPFYERRDDDDDGRVDMILNKAQRVDKLFQHIRDNFTFKNVEEVNVVVAIFKQIVVKTFDRDARGLEHSMITDIYEDLLGHASGKGFDEEQMELQEKLSNVVRVGVRNRLVSVAESMVRTLR